MCEIGRADLDKAHMLNLYGLALVFLLSFNETDSQNSTRYTFHLGVPMLLRGFY